MSIIANGDCAAPDCKGTATRIFEAFVKVVRDNKNALGEDDENGAKALFGAPVALCYPHYRMAVRGEIRHWREVDKQEKVSKHGKV